MKRPSLYSSSSRSPAASRASDPAVAAEERTLPEAPPKAGGSLSPPAGPRQARWRTAYARHERPLLTATGALVALLAAWIYLALASSPVTLTQRQIDAAVLHTLESLPMESSLESVAYEFIRPSVVRVLRLNSDEDEDDTERSVGTGVVIVDNGTILTNLHVVAGRGRVVGVVFADGTESAADVIAVRPEHDLAVIQARELPDDLIPATLRSTRHLRMGDRVIAVGFPFNIGPSVTAGVISGLRRDYVTADGQRVLTNLIQFDAAANPGNSGGPLVTLDGHVVGIVTAILNTSTQRVFIGIGFAVPIENAAAGVGMSPF
jgi:S1-C subfamily serine protease